METIYKTESFSMFHCCSCGVAFCITQHFEQARVSDRKTFYCPSGHSQRFPGKTDAQRVQELRAQVVSKDDLLQSTRRERDKHWRLQRAAEGKARALKRRVAADVCPCCQCTFQDLARHMKGQHPGFGSGE